MPFPDPEAFRHAAATLYSQRGQLQNNVVADAAHLARLEEQLRYHLHHLASQPAAEEPNNEATWFVDLAAGLMSSDHKRSQTSFSQAASLLSQNGPGSTGAFDALALTRPDDPDHALLALYKEKTALRPTLFALWQEQNAQLPPALTNLAELQGRDTILQRAALAYAAANAKIGLDLFRAYYRPLLSGHGGRQLESKATDIAIWGGMVRGDKDAHLALRHALELEDNPLYQAALLRLGALNATPDILPVLRQHMASNPQNGTWLLALHGSAEAIAILLEALDQPATANHAAQAWHWLSGQMLPEKARLTVVGSEDSPTAGTLPESSMAKSWWQSAKSQAKAGERWLAGKPYSTLALTRQSWHLAGQQGQDALDLLALATGKPMGLSAKSEQRRRRSYLTELINQQPVATEQRGHAHV